MTELIVAVAGAVLVAGVAVWVYGVISKWLEEWE